MKFLLDTNRYTDFCGGVPESVAVHRRAEKIFMPYVTLAELRAGFACGMQGKQNEATLVRYLGSPRVDILYADEATTHHYASLYRQLREQGTPIPMNDLWIAALAVQHDLPIHTRDPHFRCLPQIPVL